MYSTEQVPSSLSIGQKGNNRHDMPSVSGLLKGLGHQMD
jgi:hypothetical protein